MIRGKIHYGVHLLALDDGNHSIWDAVVAEFQDLWNHGIVSNGIRYRVAIIRIVLDGKGLQDLTKTMGTLSF